MPNYTGVLAHNVLLQHLIIYFSISVLLLFLFFFLLWLGNERMEGGGDGAGLR